MAAMFVALSELVMEQGAIAEEVNSRLVVSNRLRALLLCHIDPFADTKSHSFVEGIHAVVDEAATFFFRSF